MFEAGGVVVVDIVVNTAVANFIGGLNNFVDIIGDAINFAITIFDSLKWSHLHSEEAIKRLPE